ncbi:hypothetical protein [Colwellia echini]|uniref:Lipoprotein n=1 Tax=Colwellia echini TaxID=1982103 RepID=A0ABY3MSI1_9GAMM|nr:hypothetical protein [Colwellia echini]TYK64163.1 hypothetical protein CWS31_017130 [Colwellia echini]
MKIKLWMLLLSFFLISCDDDSSTSLVEDTIDVYISKGDTQCNDDGLSIEETASYLTNSDIKALESQCGIISGLSFTAVCGGGTGNIYIHTIDIDDLDAAENLGFIDASSLIVEDSGYAVVECE